MIYCFLRKMSREKEKQECVSLEDTPRTLDKGKGVLDPNVWKINNSLYQYGHKPGEKKKEEKPLVPSKQTCEK